MGWFGSLSTNEIRERVPMHVVESPTIEGEPATPLKVGDTIPVEYANGRRDGLDVLEASGDEAIVQQKNGTKWKISHAKTGEAWPVVNTPSLNSQDWVFRNKLEA